ncbi:MAG: ABC transporter permease, partial [Pseudobacter sp.]|uniref:ABC transporter permease n=1 Tax=Pseudobacter sp. TaxID=2045420 RepID=UPI003F7F82C7
MRLILKIARAELRTLFYSPIAWVVIIVFFVITGVLFVDPLVEISRVQEVAMENSPFYEGNIYGYTLTLFTGTFDAILSYLYLFIPFLTMGAISRELNNGTIKFLYSSPVRIRELVLGKYLGLLFFNGFLLAAIAILLITGMFSIQHVEYKVYLSAFLGIFLLSSTYTAIGLFISSLTSYQLVAGLVTFMVFILLSFISNFGQQYDFVRDLTWFLSLPNRVDRLITGLITSRDILYFLLIIIMFLGFSIVKLKSTQESKKKTVLYFRYLVILTVILGLGYFS